MYNLIKFIGQYHFFFLFLFLQIFNVVLIFQYNSYQKTGFINSANKVTGSVYQSFNKITHYIGLQAVNEQLALENAQLKNQLKKVYYSEIPTLINDTIFKYDTLCVDTFKSFNCIAANIISNTINKQKNIIFIDKGNRDKVEKGMGVLSSQGVVGVVLQSSKNYATIMPIIHRDVFISAKIKNTGYFGNLSWNGKNIQIAQLSEIPNHISPSKGDSIVTSGYSHLFPADEFIGFIDDFSEIPGTGFLSINVNLATNFARLKHVYIVENIYLNEINEIFE